MLSQNTAYGCFVYNIHRRNPKFIKNQCVGEDVGGKMDGWWMNVGLRRDVSPVEIWGLAGKSERVEGDAMGLSFDDACRLP